MSALPPDNPVPADPESHATSQSARSLDAAAAFVRSAWMSDAPRADRLVAAWRDQHPRSDAETPVADLLAADVEMRASRGVDFRIEAYLDEWPDLASHPDACRAILMFEFARLDPVALASAVQRITATHLALAAEAQSVATLCEIMGLADDQPREGSHLAKYRLVSRLGSGAFGAVWLARDEELGRFIALKLLHASDNASLKRVMAEAQAAAALDHPNVVKIHAAGRLDSGRGFIDTQLVGEPAPTADNPDHVRVGTALDLAGEPAAPRDPRWAARMMHAVALGVAAAHARGVIHRDIKPANIIVSPAGVPMLADFGLSALAPQGPAYARSASAAASMSVGRITGTPAFMSPEQARGERATPASDIYALGATLRFLLTGDLPVKPTGRHSTQARADVLEQLKRGDLASLESRDSTLPRPIVRICDKAMSPKPEDRYLSASAMAADLNAWLTSRPTVAGRESRPRRGWLWYRRHFASATIAAAALATLAISTERFIAGIQEQRDRAVNAERTTEERRKQAVQQRDRAYAAESIAESRRVDAERAREIMSKTNLFMQEALTSAHADRGGRNISMYEAIVLASGRVAETVRGDPLVEAGVRHVIGSVLYSMGEFGQARPHLDTALKIRLERLGPDHYDTLVTRFALAELESYGERGDRAAAFAESLLADLQARLPANAELELSTRELLVQIRLQQGRDEDAEKLIHAVLNARLAEDPPKPLRIAMAHSQLGELAKSRGKRDEAIDHFKTALDLRRRELTDDSLGVASVMNDLGSVYAEMNNVAEAEPLQRAALAWFEQNLGDKHVNTHNAAHNLAWMLLTKKKQPAESLDIAARFAPLAEAALSPDNPVAVRIRLVEGRALASLGRHADAEPVLKAVVTRVEQWGPAGLVPDAVASRTLAECFRKLNREPEATDWQKRADDKTRQARGG